MERSKDYATDLGARLRERIYDDVIPQLAESIASARDLDDPDKDALDNTYEMAMVLLYRLLFIAYAEDEEFLPGGGTIATISARSNRKRTTSTISSRRAVRSTRTVRSTGTM